MPEPKHQFTVHGPFPVPYMSAGNGTSKRIDRDNAAQFWTDSGPAALGAARGCYVFALAVSGGFTPWYVGKTTKSFKVEVLQDHKLVHYNDVVFSGNKGKPVIFLVALSGAKGRAIPRAEIDSLETFLIQSAVIKNPKLKNVKKAAYPDWGVRGVIRGGKGNVPMPARRFKSALGL